jgi:hypothetical protein
MRGGRRCDGHASSGRQVRLSALSTGTLIVLRAKTGDRCVHSALCAAAGLVLASQDQREHHDTRDQIEDVFNSDSPTAGVRSGPVSGVSRLAAIWFRLRRQLNLNKYTIPVACGQ